MKKYIRALLLVITVAAALCLAGCNKQIEDIRGVWRSNDGYVLVLTDDTLTLIDDKGENVLPSGAMQYEWSADGKIISVVKDGAKYDVWNCYLSEDFLKLTYTEELQALVGEEDTRPIRLYRVR